jgi:tRNA(Ile)-lysidine synthase
VNTYNKAINFIKENDLIKKGDKIILALSGGGDSVFLFHLFIFLKKLLDIEFHCFHLNHNLRGNDSLLDEDFCINLCSQYNITLTVKSADIKKCAIETKKSIEDTARQIRYKELIELKTNINFNKIATAHNLDDNIETVLQRLIEGTGLKGLNGIPIIREGFIIRPLLCLTKNEINTFLKDNGLMYRFDKSNDDLTYKRNFIRHKLIPIISEFNSAYQVGIQRTVKNLNGISEFYFKEIRKITEGFIKTDKHNIYIDLAIFDENGLTVISECIKIKLEEKFNYRFDFLDAEKLANIKNIQVGKFLELKEEIFLFRDRDKLILSKKIKKNDEIVKLTVGVPINIGDIKLFSEVTDIEKINFKDKLTNEEYLDFNLIDSKNLYIRTWKSGDFFNPLGMKGSKKISDFLTDNKIDVITKANQKVLVNVNEIIYVIGYRINDKYKITNKTKKVLKLWIDLT